MSLKSAQQKKLELGLIEHSPLDQAKQILIKEINESDTLPVEIENKVLCSLIMKRSFPHVELITWLEDFGYYMKLICELFGFYEETILNGEQMYEEDLDKVIICTL